MMKKVFLLVTCLLFAFSGVADAALNDLGFGAIVGDGQYKLVYDDVLDITWLDFTHTQAGGTWSNQMNWAADLEVEYNGQVFSDWRLPIIDASIPVGTGYGYVGPNGDGSYSYLYGYNMTNSELGHLFYESLSNDGYRATDFSINNPYGLTNTGLFNNLENARYWLGTEESATEAWVFGLNYGYLQIIGKDPDTLYAIAVHPGDIAASPVPVPGAMLLLGSGLIGIGGIRRKMKK